MDFRVVREEDLYVNLFKYRWLLRIDVLDDLKRHPPAPTFVPPKLEEFKALVCLGATVFLYIRTYRSSTRGDPLIYLLRPVSVPTPETMAKDYEDIDETLVETFSLTVSFARDYSIFFIIN
jgi:hypothetical protein